MIKIGVLIIFIFVVSFAPIKLDKKLTSAKDNYFGVSSIPILKTLGTILVVICHIFYGLKGGALLSIYQSLGYYAVGIFFLISGYGLVVGYLKNNKYDNGFFKNRIIKVLLPIWIITVLYNIIGIIINKQALSFREWIYSLFLIKPIHPHYWYLQCIIFFYIIFWLSIFFIKNKKVAICVTFIVSLVFSIYHLVQNGIWKSTLAFCLGIIIAMSANRLHLLVKKHYFVLLLIMSIIFATSYSYFIILKYHFSPNGILELISGIVSQLVFALFLVLLLDILIIKNKLCKKISIISFEIFLIHGLIIDIIKSFSTNLIIILIGTIVFSIVIAILLHFINNRIYTFLFARNIRGT